MPDFLTTAPDKKITDPRNLGHITDYPQTLYKSSEGDGLTIAWRGKDPVVNAVLSVGDDAAKTAALKDGWTTAPVFPKDKK